MQRTIVSREEIKLVGIKARTNNKNEASPKTTQILPCIEKYFQEQIYDKILYQKDAETLICAYAEYEKDYTADYTFFMGQEVTKAEAIPVGLSTLIIPPQTYVKFTTDPGPMPVVVQDAWREIWKMTPEELGGTRNYKADFEVYDQRARNQLRAVLDIYIGIKEPG